MADRNNARPGRYAAGGWMGQRWVACDDVGCAGRWLALCVVPAGGGDSRQRGRRPCVCGPARRLYTPRVYVDGKFIGAGSDGWSPTIVEITEAITPGKRHQIAIRCQDRGAFFPEGFVLRNGMSDEQQRGKTLGPVGGYKNMVGLWDRVLLRVTPEKYIDSDELVIVPSTRKSSLTISGKAAASGAVIIGEVLDGEKVVLALPAAKIADDGTWSVSSAFANARYWSPEDPHLYSLRADAAHRARLGRCGSVTQRFGFKEIWIEGPDFYLNGVKRHLLATSTWPVPGI